MAKEYGGNIKGFPEEIVELMLQRQFEYKGIRSIEKIEIEPTAQFLWLSTPEEMDENETSNFWMRVILDRDFDLFFKRYPKKPAQLSLF